MKFVIIYLLLHQKKQRKIFFNRKINTTDTMKTKDWPSKGKAKLLLIGHDPRLRETDTIAEYALFANYYFASEPKAPSEKRKFGLAKSTFEHVFYLTMNKIKPEEIYVTNLCNDALPHAPKGKSVLIPQDIAADGVVRLHEILKQNASITYILPMSLQVNYWLQKLEFYNSHNNFISDTNLKQKE